MRFMTLTTHAVVGAAAASLFPTNPALAFSAGFVSHLVIDSLPHWDYRVLSKKQDFNRLNDDMNVYDKRFVYDLLRIGGDALLGTILAIYIFSFWLFDLPVWFVVLGAWAGILPDPLQFVYWKTRSKLLLPLQRFHVWIQKGKSIEVSPIVGLFLQCILVFLVVSALKFF